MTLIKLSNSTEVELLLQILDASEKELTAPSATKISKEQSLEVTNHLRIIQHIRTQIFKQYMKQ